MSADLRASRKLAVVGGLAAAVLFAVGNAIWALEMPEDGTAVPAVLDFYRETADRIVIGGSISLLSIGAFVLFAAAVRQVIVDEGGDPALATTAFGGAVLGMAAGLGAESINLVAALRARDGELSEGLGQSLFEISQILGSTATAVGLGVFALAVAAAAIRADAILPRPVSLLNLAAGVLLLTPLSHLNWFAGAGLVLIAVSLSIGLARGGTGRVEQARAT